MNRRTTRALAGLSILFAVAGRTAPLVDPSNASDAQAQPPGKRQILPPVPAEAAPRASARLNSTGGDHLPTLIGRYFEDHVGRRLYIQVDKPLYRPGETLWFKTWDLQARTLAGANTPQTTVELVSPKGATVLRKRLQSASGGATNHFDLPAEVQGGEYLLRATAADGHKAERTVIVSAYEPPRLKKKLEFVKKAYGAGDTVSATVEVRRPTGEALAGKALAAVITVDGVELPRVKVTSNADGGALVKFELPRVLAGGDGLLTVLVEDGGVTESISKAIPLVQKRLSLAFFPEGGKMVAGLPTRLYFEAKTLLGKPADIEGRLVDDLGNAVAAFASVKNGLGRIEFTPATGRNYHAEVTRPSSITEKVTLPLAEATGCVMRTYDDFDGQEKALRIGVRCTEPRRVTVAATVRENLLDVGTIEAGDETPGVIHLAAADTAPGHAARAAGAAGVARITVFDQNLDPLAERLVFRNRRARLQVLAELDKKTYSPRGQVALAITTRDASSGKAVPAELALSVVDDTVISFADDKSGHLLSKLLLEPELPGKVEEPNFYLDLTEAKSALALDLLMGARGYRRFDWVAVLRPAVPTSALAIAADGRAKRAAGALGAGELERREVQARMAPPPAMPAQAGPPPLRAPLPAAAPVPRDAAKREAPAAPPVVREPQVAADAMRPQIALAEMDLRKAGEAGRADMAVDRDFARATKQALNKFVAEEVAFAPVRVFPIPAFNPEHTGPRDDFRETVFWAPSVKTNRWGKATVKFVLSDAVTSFRVFSEGVASAGGGAGSGLAGRDETVFKSALPFSLAVKLPLEVSAGDRPLIPVTLSNDGERALDVKLDARFGALLRAAAGAAAGGQGNKLAGGQGNKLAGGQGNKLADGQGNKLAEGQSSKLADGQGGKLAAGQRKSLFFPLEVTGTRGQSDVRVSAAAGGLGDEVLRSIPVVPLGFPQLFERSGQIVGQASHELDLGSARPGSVQATVTVYTSMLSTTMSGLAGMLREPSGCFEQTSSTNYPNVMIMQYLKQHDVADAALVERSSRLLDSGYKKLTGYESRRAGFEWFGGDPGHEALTAYGLLQFADMSDVYGAVDPTLLARTGAWLKSRRDGNGGYLRDAKALDSFGRASPEVTDAYITWALATAGVTGIEKEIEKSMKLVETTQDAYQLALATGTLLQRPARSDGSAASKAALAAAAKLARMQAASGAWTNADHSITKSGGVNLTIETTSLAILALLKADGYLENARKGIAWLQSNRGGFGQWGATQATVLALKAMTRFDDVTRVARRAGAVSLLIDGVVVAEQSFEAGQREPIVFTGFDAKLMPGKHSIALTSKSADPLPYSMAVEYRSTEPASSNAAVVHLAATLAKSEVKMGETVRLTAIITNKTQNGQPMTLARLGLPGGLTFQNWQLKDLREKGQIAFFETRAREVILYFRDMKPGEAKRLAIDLVATVPGSYTGPASAAYLYYNDTHKSWAAPLAIGIAP